MTRTEVRTPNEREVKQAIVARDELRALAEAMEQFPGEPANLPSDVELPRLALLVLIDLLSELAEGNSVQLVPINEELTTQQAADLLNVSRPYLIRLLEEDRIPYRLVGNRRRIRSEDVLAYKRLDDAHRREVLAALSAEGQALGIEY